MRQEVCDDYGEEDIGEECCDSSWVEVHDQCLLRRLFGLCGLVAKHSDYLILALGEMFVGWEAAFKAKVRGIFVMRRFQVRRGGTI